MINHVDNHRLAQSENAEERKRSVEELNNNFAIFQYQEQAWDDLHKLTHDKSDYVRSGAAVALGTCYSRIPEEHRKQAWDDLIGLMQDEIVSVRWGAAVALASCYSHIPVEYRKQACNDLHILTYDKKVSVLMGAAVALSSCYSHIPVEYRKQAWDDLYRLTQNKNKSVRWGAAVALGSCYSHIPDKNKKQAWDDLHKLTYDKKVSVRWGVAVALGSCYSHIPNIYRKNTWEDLYELTQDKDKDVRVASNYSSGRVSIYKASQAKGDESAKKELETALRFFEKSSKESTYFNPAKFCLPFYRSFYAITFRKEDVEAEVKKYLVEAKSALEGSVSKEKLLEAVENLGNALNEAQKARESNEIKSDLNAYRRYFDRVCELLDTTEKKASGTSRLIRKGLPIIDERILEEIREKAKMLCKQVKNTEYKEIGQQVNNFGQELLKVRDMIALEKGIYNLLIPLSAMCEKIPEEDKREACVLLKQINSEEYIENKLPLIGMFLSKVSTQMNKEKEPNMENIVIKNSKDVQVVIGKNNHQAQDLNSPKKKHLKKSTLDVLDSSATVAAFIGFLAVEIGAHFYPLSYNHLISAIAAAISFIMVAMLNRR